MGSLCLTQDGTEPRRVFLRHRRNRPSASPNVRYYRTPSQEWRIRTLRATREGNGRNELTRAAEASKRNLEAAKGQVAQQIAGVAGLLAQAKLTADSSLVQSQNEAEAILIEARANAQAIEKRNEALAGAGGRTMVKLKIAEAMAGKRIVMLPSKGANIQTLDINQLVGNITAGKAGLSK